MGPDVDLRDLQHAATYIVVRNRLRLMSAGSILLGLLATAKGMAVYDLPEADLALLIIGICLTGVSLWILTSASPIGLLLDMLGVAAFGIWHVLAYADGRQGAFAIFLGLFAAKWSYDLYIEYQRLSTLSAERPSDESIRFMTNLIASILSRRVEDSKDLIQIRMNRISCRVGLLDRAAVLVAENARGVSVLNREDFNLRNNGTSIDGRTVWVSDEIFGDMPVSMTPEHYARYGDWKGEPSPTEADSVSEAGPEAAE